VYHNVYHNKYAAIPLDAAFLAGYAIPQFEHEDEVRGNTAKWQRLALG
jgi:hypothetical protein